MHISVLQGWGREVVLAHSVDCGTIKAVLKNVFVICVVLARSSQKQRQELVQLLVLKHQKAAVVISLKQPNASLMRPVSSSTEYPWNTVTFLRVFKFLYQCTLF